MFICSTLQLTESTTLPLNLNINDLSASRTVKEVLDTLCLIKQFSRRSLYKYEYADTDLFEECHEIDVPKDTDVRFYYDDTQIMPGEIVNLGLLKVSTSYIKLTIKNEDTLSSVPKTLSIERYSDYYSGYKNILMSISDSNEYPENNIYTNTVTLPALEPEEVKYLYLWLNKNPEIDNFLAIDFRFKLVIQ